MSRQRPINRIFTISAVLLSIAFMGSTLIAQTSATNGVAVYPYPEYVQPMYGGSSHYSSPVLAAPQVVPTLGITPASAFRPGGPYYRPHFHYQRAYRLPVAPGPAPGLTVEIPPADTAPAITYPQPSYPNVTSGSTVQLPPLGATWPAAPPPQRLQPLVRLQNMPPGTYPGQGIIGQPKAYVDGQPVRNLLRYLSLW